MNLTKLFEMQKALDEYIEKEHPREQGEKRLQKKINSIKRKPKRNDRGLNN